MVTTVAFSGSPTTPMYYYFEFFYSWADCWKLKCKSPMEEKFGLFTTQQHSIPKHLINQLIFRPFSLFFISPHLLLRLLLCPFITSLTISTRLGRVKATLITTHTYRHTHTQHHRSINQAKMKEGKNGVGAATTTTTKRGQSIRARGKRWCR